MCFSGSTYRALIWVYGANLVYLASQEKGRAVLLKLCRNVSKRHLTCSCIRSLSCVIFSVSSGWLVMYSLSKKACKRRKKAKSNLWSSTVALHHPKTPNLTEMNIFSPFYTYFIHTDSEIMRTDDKLLCFVIKYMFCTFVYKRKL